MIHNDPSGVPNSAHINLRGFRPPAARTPGHPQPTVFPRNSWQDPQALSSSLHEAINKMRNDFSAYFHWRRPFNFAPPAGPPMAAPMYGMPSPGTPPGIGGPFPSPNPSPPMAAPMYGMPSPGTPPGGPGFGGGPIGPPVASPMYGMPAPDGRIGFPQPERPPFAAPMYGMPNPGGGDFGGGGSVMMPMYGMPNP